MNIQLLNDEQRQNAIRLFGSAIKRRWRIPAEIASTWVREEYLHPDTRAFGVMRHAGRRGLHGCIFGCPLRVMASSTEQDALSDRLHIPSQQIWFMGGLAVIQSAEHMHITRSLLESVCEAGRLSGHQEFIGITVLPFKRGGRFVHHWTRLQSLGMQLIANMPSTRSIESEGFPLYWIHLKKRTTPR